MAYESERCKRIRIGLIRRGLRQKDIWVRLGVSSSGLTQVINGRMRSRRIEQAIADAIEVALTDLWPDRATQGKAA